jgi:hypothetical protein
MNKRQIHTTSRYVSSIFMMLVLAWLTISIPFVYAAQENIQAKSKTTASTTTNSEEKSNNPFANTTEEKTPGNSNSLSEEYIHEPHSIEHFQTEFSRQYKIEQFSTYIAFYGELLSPPPDHC